MAATDAKDNFAKRLSRKMEEGMKAQRHQRELAATAEALKKNRALDRDVAAHRNKKDHFEKRLDRKKKEGGKEHRQHRRESAATAEALKKNRSPDRAVAAQRNKMSAADAKDNFEKRLYRKMEEGGKAHRLYRRESAATTKAPAISTKTTSASRRPRSRPSQQEHAQRFAVRGGVDSVPVYVPSTAPITPSLDPSLLRNSDSTRDSLASKSLDPELLFNGLRDHDAGVSDDAASVDTEHSLAGVAEQAIASKEYYSEIAEAISLAVAALGTKEVVRMVDVASAKVAGDDNNGGSCDGRKNGKMDKRLTFGTTKEDSMQWSCLLETDRTSKKNLNEDETITCDLSESLMEQIKLSGADIDEILGNAVPKLMGKSTGVSSSPESKKPVLGRVERERKKRLMNGLTDLLQASNVDSSASKEESLSAILMELIQLSGADIDEILGNAVPKLMGKSADVSSSLEGKRPVLGRVESERRKSLMNGLTDLLQASNVDLNGIVDSEASKRMLSNGRPDLTREAGGRMMSLNQCPT